MQDDFTVAFAEHYIKAFQPEFGLTNADMNKIKEFIAFHPKANQPLAVDAVAEAAKKEGNYPVSYVLAIADRFYRDAWKEDADVPDRWMAAYQRQKKRVAELVEEHFSTEHYLKYKCKGPTCIRDVRVPSGAQERLM